MNIINVLKLSDEKYRVQARLDEGNDVTIDVTLRRAEPNVIFDNFPNLATDENINSVIQDFINRGILVRKD